MWFHFILLINLDQEGYFSFQNLSDRENIAFALLKVTPHVKHWWETLYKKKEIGVPHYLHLHPLGFPLWMLSRNNTTLLEVVTTCIQNGPHYDRKETKQC
jgi:hypothetical protein